MEAGGSRISEVSQTGPRSSVAVQDQATGLHKGDSQEPLVTIEQM